jgi:signal transduction histidine kinase
LRVPLVAKLVGANLLVVALLLAAWLMAGGPLNRAVVVILGTVIAIHLGLVLIALHPVRDLEAVASRVWRGDFGARVEGSSIADNGVLRVGSMFNILLDSLASDQAQMRALATEVIAAGDRERAALARELHDSTAQHVAALLLQLSAAARDADDPALARRLDAARDAAEGILEELRQLSRRPCGSWRATRRTETGSTSTSVWIRCPTVSHRTWRRCSIALPRKRFGTPRVTLRLGGSESICTRRRLR